MVFVRADLVTTTIENVGGNSTTADMQKHLDAKKDRDRLAREWDFDGAQFFQGRGSQSFNRNASFATLKVIKEITSIYYY